MGLTSLRQKYLNAEDIWLNNEVLDEDTAPDNDPIYDFDNNEMALLNSIGEVKIGTDIIKYLDSEQITVLNELVKKGGLKNKTNLVALDEAYLVIDDGDFNTLISYNEGDTSVIDQSNVTVVSSTPPVDCGNSEDRKYIDMPNDKRIKAIIKAPGERFGGNGKVKAKIKSYKKGGLFGWKRWRTNLFVGLNGNVYDTSCSNYAVQLDESKNYNAKRRKKLKYIFNNKYWDTHVVENGDVKGIYKQNGVIKEFILSW